MREKLEFKNVNSPIIELCQLELRRESEKVLMSQFVQRVMKEVC